jgi:hypothetical protein
MFAFKTVIRFTSLTAVILLTTASATEPWRIVTQWDNDLLTGTDRGYTNGARLAIVRDLEPNREAHNALQRAFYRISRAGSDGIAGDDGRFDSIDQLRFSWGLGITQLMYTPDDSTTPSALPGERPYAGWLGAEISLNVSDFNSVSGVTLSIGTTGPSSRAEQAQDWVHNHISNSPIYQGWDSQVPSEPTLNLHFDRKQKLSFLDATKDWLLEIDGYYEWGAAVGNFQTNAYIGTLLRTGLNLPNTYATPRVQLGSYGHALFEPESDDSEKIAFYGFVGIRATAVLHDITLDGPIFRDFNTGVDSKPTVGEAIVGLAVRIHDVDLSISQTTRSDEFKGQTKRHNFGSVMLRFDLPF